MRDKSPGWSPSTGDSSRALTISFARSHEIMGNHRRQTQRGRLELGLGLTVDSQGRTIWIVDAHRGDGKRFIVRADEMLSAFVELERQVLTVTFYL